MKTVYKELLSFHIAMVAMVKIYQFLPLLCDDDVLMLSFSMRQLSELKRYAGQMTMAIFSNYI